MIYGYLLALRRMFRTWYIPLLLAAYLIISLIAVSSVVTEQTLPAAAVVDLDGTDGSRCVTETLKGCGFILCSDEEELRTGVALGTYDCGVIIPEGFSGDLKTGNMNECVVFVESPTSYIPDLFKNHAAAAVFDAYAPYVSYDSLKDTDITADEIAAAYREVMKEGNLFSFRITYSDDTRQAPNVRGKLFFLEFSSVFFFGMISHTVYSTFVGNTVPLLKRIKVRTAFLWTALPDFLVQLFLYAAVYTAACLAVCRITDIPVPELLWSGLVFLLIAGLFAVLLLSFSLSDKWIHGVSFCVLLAAAVLSPLFIDLSTVIPLIGKIRRFLPTNWIYLLTESPKNAGILLISLIVLASAGLFYRMHRAVRT